MLAEVNKVYHRYRRYTAQHGYWALTTKQESSILRRPRRTKTILLRAAHSKSPKHYASKPGKHIQWHNATCQCELHTRYLQHGSTILHTSPGTIQAPTRSATNTVITVDIQLIHTGTKQQHNSSRSNNYTVRSTTKVTEHSQKASTSC